jgi:hypothetical protein
MRRLTAAALGCALVALPGLARAAECGGEVACKCGDVVVASRRLTDADPVTRTTCADTALVVNVPAGQAAATLDLGGRQLTGSGHGVGVQVVRGGAGGLRLVGPGDVEGFDVGVSAVAGALAAVENVTASDGTSDGFALTGDGYAVSGCEAARNGRDGFVLRGARFRVDGNRAHENRRAGFRIAGVDAQIGVTAGNEASANGRGGLVVAGRGDDVVAATAIANGGRGISARVAHGRIAGAHTSRNGGAGLVATGTALTVKGSDARENAGGGLSVRGPDVRDAGGNAASGNAPGRRRRDAECRVGTACR